MKPRHGHGHEKMSKLKKNVEHGHGSLITIKLIRGLL